jgi:NTE family protein
MMDGFFEKRAEAKRVAAARPGLIDLMSSSLDTMQGQLARVQLAMDPPDLLIRIPHDVCMFYEFWRARELIDIGRAAAEQALDQAN